MSTANVLPEGFSVINASTGSRMWIGPDGVAVHAYPLPDRWEATFVTGEVTVIRSLSYEELEVAAVEHCRRLVDPGSVVVDEFDRVKAVVDGASA